ncbi:MAG: hypothetical protein ING84_16480 [Cytophagales bacterium]|nr:hypothetical protein [Cytophagales bacterium]MCA6369102.1 hypothetical protein [Cytophagales bacterium]MCA6370172.1 hypothetical protein [Cytophagales bacterium]MCA6376999.1 hypothetical protein [Cytophagales bacterium]MCA6381952.1 hypothetical protein [Cytophagales bacterium]
MRKVVVVDNTALINLTILGDFSIFNLLKNLFFQIHIPSKVKSEYEFILRHKPERAWLLEKLKPNTGFYSFCTRYDSVVLCTIQTVKDIDAGEAKAVAQFLKVNANYILSDDHRFTVALKMKEPNIKVLSTLHILAILDLNRITLDVDKLIQVLHRERPFSKSKLRKAYVDSHIELGIRMSKKWVDKKCDFARLKVT